ncbi:GDSL-type esterase/lipase family protein [Kribbella sp. NPDC048928]|uniref:GDSL-type esterase/lipase family protein n=1 Tax=Kribbella sp. NPDC048928 TaxID=3364111 RepID=UPI0037196F2C
MMGGAGLLPQIVEGPPKVSRARAFLESLTAVVVTLMVLAALGGVLVALEPRAKSTDTLVGGGAYSVPTKGPGAYGSGTLGPWQALSHRISTEDQVRDVLAFDGVFLFGDSIAVQDSPTLERLLADRSGDLIAFHDWSGQPATAAVDALEQWSHHYGLPNRIVMAVGTNDIFDPPAFTAQVERALRIAGPNRTVYWVNVYASRIKVAAPLRQADLANSAWINQQLEAAVAQHPNLRIIDWSGFLESQPNRPAQYLRDGVHTTPLGAAARNELIADAIEH